MENPPWEEAKMVLLIESIKMSNWKEGLIAIHKFTELKLKSLVQLRQGRNKNKHDQ